MYRATWPFIVLFCFVALQVRPINFSDFEKALLQVRASVAPRDLKLYLDWNAQFGSAELAAETDS